MLKPKNVHACLVSLPQGVNKLVHQIIIGLKLGFLFNNIPLYNILSPVRPHYLGCTAYSVRRLPWYTTCCHIPSYLRFERERVNQSKQQICGHRGTWLRSEPQKIAEDRLDFNL